MIIFFESGGLGNQLFQYCAMRKFEPKGPILAIGMLELKRGFRGIDLLGSTCLEKAFERSLRRLGKKRIAFLARRLGLFTFVEETRMKTRSEFKVAPGYIRNVVYFDESYYQAENMVDPQIARQISIRPKIEGKAARLLSDLPCRPEDRYFVHVRRGDFTYWPSPAAPAVLPLAWYRRQMARIRQRRPQAFFVVVSDDRPYVEEFLSGEGVWISRGNALDDLAIMSQCLGGGILSASSFSWWGAHFCRRQSPGGRFIAPRWNENSGELLPQVFWEMDGFEFVDRL